MPFKVVIKGLKVKIPPIKPMTWKQKVYDKGVATEARKKTFLTAKAGHMGEAVLTQVVLR